MSSLLKHVGGLRILAEDDSSDDPTGLKFGVMIAVLISGSFVFFPYSKMMRNQKSNRNHHVHSDVDDEVEEQKGCCKGRLFSLCNCFAAGMLLSISMMHILPEAKMIYMSYLEVLEKEMKTDDKDEHAQHSGFPLPFVLFFSGFVFMLMLD